MNQEKMNQLVASVFDKQENEYLSENVIAFRKEETDAERKAALDDWYQGIVDHMQLIETTSQGCEFHKQEALDRIQMLLKVLTGKYYE